MKILFQVFILIGLSTPTSLFSQAQTAEVPRYVRDLDSTLATLYSVISGEKGEARDWDLFRSLFHPDAKLIPTAKNEGGSISANYMTPEDYIEKGGPYLVENGFFEIEIHREVDSFGPITQVFSTYESYRSKNDTQPFARGINSIQLLNDGQRWWVLSIYWSQESPEQPIPLKYLPK
ncbi:MAG: hypothetical protein ACI9L9_000727 [Marivirga sp.]|jgi:hypothetical protein